MISWFIYTSPQLNINIIQTLVVAPYGLDTVGVVAICLVAIVTMRMMIIVTILPWVLLELFHMRDTVDYQPAAVLKDVALLP